MKTFPAPSPQTVEIAKTGTFLEFCKAWRPEVSFVENEYLYCPTLKTCRAMFEMIRAGLPALPITISPNDVTKDRRHHP